MLALGPHIVTCVASDGISATNTSQFLVRVVDTTAPVIQAPSNMVVEATGPLGSTVIFNVTAQDASDAAPHLVCSPASGSIFRRGTTVVRCTAWDYNGNTNETSFDVTVVDSQAPQLTCQTNVTLIKTRPEGTPFSYDLHVSDMADTNVMVEYSAPPGATFPPGTTRVTCAIMDRSGNRNTCSFDVTVIDANPGAISALTASGGIRMSIPTQAGVQYQVEYKNSLDEPTWQPLTTLLGDGTVMTVTDPEPADLMRFYRVRAP
jgi:hypothetical protein